MEEACNNGKEEIKMKNITDEKIMQKVGEFDSSMSAALQVAQEKQLAQLGDLQQMLRLEQGKVRDLEDVLQRVMDARIEMGMIKEECVDRAVGARTNRGRRRWRCKPWWWWPRMQQ